MGLFKVAALAAFLLAVLSCFGWGIDWSLRTDLGLVAAGLLFEVAAVLQVPQPPPAR